MIVKCLIGQNLKFSKHKFTEDKIKSYLKSLNFEYYKDKEDENAFYIIKYRKIITTEEEIDEIKKDLIEIMKKTSKKFRLWIVNDLNTTGNILTEVKLSIQTFKKQESV